LPCPSFRIHPADLVSAVANRPSLDEVGVGVDLRPILLEVVVVQADLAPEVVKDDLPQQACAQVCDAQMRLLADRH